MQPRNLSTLLLSMALGACSAATAKSVTPDDVGRTTATILQKVTSDWKYSSLEPMLDPMFRDEERFRETLATGKALGQLKFCPEGEMDLLAEIPNALKYSAICTFEKGSAKIYLAFGVAKDGSPIVFGLDLYPVAEQ